MPRHLAGRDPASRGHYRLIFARPAGKPGLLGAIRRAATIYFQDDLDWGSGTHAGESVTGVPGHNVAHVVIDDLQD